MSLYISTGSVGYILGIKRAFRDIENPEVWDPVVLLVTDFQGFYTGSCARFKQWGF